MTDFSNTHNIDNDPCILEVRFTESEISEKLKAAEQKLQDKKILVTRQIRQTLDNRVCFALQIFADDASYIMKVREIVGQGYQLILNVNQQQLVIK